MKSKYIIKALFILLSFALPGCSMKGYDAGDIVTYMRHPHLDWPEQKGIDHYIIEIAKDKTFKNIVDTDKVYVSRYVPFEPLEAGEYFWRIKPVDIKGKMKSWSDTYKLSVTDPDNIFVVPDNASFQEFTTILKEACSKTPAKIIFPEKGTFRWKTAKNASVIDIKNVSNLIIDGNESKVWITDITNGFCNLYDTNFIEVANFEVDYDPKPYSAGVITGIDRTTKKIRVQLLPDQIAYDQAGYNWIYGTIVDKRALTDPRYAGRIKYGGPFGFNYAGDTKIGDGIYELSNVAYLGAMEIGDVFVKTHRQGALIQLIKARDNTVYNLTARASRGTFVGDAQGSRNSYLNTSTIPGPGDMMVATADAIHPRAQEIGSWIEGCHLQGHVDDMMNIGSVGFGIVRQIDSRRFVFTLKDRDYEQTYVGDELAFYEPSIPGFVAAAIVSEIQEINGEKVYTMDRDLPEMKAGINERNTWGADAEKIQYTIVFNRRWDCRDTVVRNNSITNGVRIGVVYKGTNIVIENNYFEGLGGNPIEIFPNMDVFEGPDSRNITILNNRFVGSGINNNNIGLFGPRTVKIGFPGMARQQQNITIRGNEFIDWEGTCIDASNVDGLTIEENLFRNSESREGTGFWISPSLKSKEVYGVHVSNSVNVKIADNEFKDSRTGLTGEIFIDKDVEQVRP